MPRQPRFEMDAGMYHVTCRGNRRCDIFLDSIDRNRFLSLLGDVVQRNRWRCVGYCLMTNHFHVVVETSEPNLGRGMHRLNGIYAQRFNQRWDYKGHLFEQRYRSREVLSEVHLAEAARYVVLNPVRAGICRLPERWPWSSYRATMGTAAAPRFLAVADLLAFFGNSREEARRAFAAFVRDGLEMRRR